MTLKSVFTILMLGFLLLACGRRGAERAESGAERDMTEIPDTVDMAPEDEIAALADTAQQEENDVLRKGEMAGAYIYVSKSRMELYVVSRADSVLFKCGIACGARRGNKTERGDYRTPEGRFRISGMFDSTDWIHRTKDGRAVKGCYGPYFLRIATGKWLGIGIHGTNAPRSIGRRASEGCIRVKSENIVKIFKQFAYDGMPVVVGGEKEPVPSFFGIPKGGFVEEPEPADTVAAVPVTPETADSAHQAADSVPASLPVSHPEADSLHQSHPPVTAGSLHEGEAAVPGG